MHKTPPLSKSDARSSTPRHSLFGLLTDPLAVMALVVVGILLITTMHSCSSTSDNRPAQAGNGEPFWLWAPSATPTETLEGVVLLDGVTGVESLTITFTDPDSALASTTPASGVPITISRNHATFSYTIKDESQLDFSKGPIRVTVHAECNSTTKSGRFMVFPTSFCTASKAGSCPCCGKSSVKATQGLRSDADQPVLAPDPERQASAPVRPLRDGEPFWLLLPPVYPGNVSAAQLSIEEPFDSHRVTLTYHPISLVDTSHPDYKPWIDVTNTNCCPITIPIPVRAQVLNQPTAIIVSATNDSGNDVGLLVVLSNTEKAKDQPAP